MIELSITDVSAGQGSACGCGGACACGGHEGHDHGAHGHSAHGHAAPEGVVVTRLAVEGMSCAHCVNAVTEELTGLAGISSVEVELAPGALSIVTVHSDLPLQEEVVRSAVSEAGYVLV